MAKKTIGLTVEKMEIESQKAINEKEAPKEEVKRTAKSSKKQGK